MMLNLIRYVKYTLTRFSLWCQTLKCTDQDLKFIMWMN